MYFAARFSRDFKDFLHAEGGASLSEYVLVASLVAVFCVIALLALRNGI